MKGRAEIFVLIVHGLMRVSYLALSSCPVASFVVRHSPRNHRPFALGADILSADEKSYENDFPLLRQEEVESRIKAVTKTSPRFQEISMTVLKNIVSPLICSIQQDGWDEETIWSRSDPETQNQTIASRITNGIQLLGPTYVKFGQALASRPDIIPTDLAEALSVLQDDMEAFDTHIAKEIIRSELLNAEVDSNGIGTIIGSMSSHPVAAASIGQVYKAYVPQFGDVAIKVQRPGIKEIVEQDAVLLRKFAQVVQPFVSARIVDAVDEFMSRLFEELDYRREIWNIERFASLYSIKYGVSKSVKVIVPEVVKPLSSEKIIVMEWIEGTKLADVKDGEDISENLELVKKCIGCTLSQLLDTGVLHSDPHDGNLFKVKTRRSGFQLGYLDFGILSTVPEQVRDGLVCAVVELVFNRDVAAVARLFGELQLLSRKVMSVPGEVKALTEALNSTFNQVLVYPKSQDDRSIVDPTPIPNLRFDVLLVALSRLVARFEFKLPPYFLNNARALATLEGIARKLDPHFNVLRVVYPYALNRILRNPSGGQVVTKTLSSCIRRPGTVFYDLGRINKILRDSAAVTGYSRFRVLRDIMSTKVGWRIARSVAMQALSNPIALFRIQRYGYQPDNTGRFRSEKRIRRKTGSFLRL